MADDPTIAPLPPPQNPFPPRNPPPVPAVSVQSGYFSGFQKWLRGLISVAISSGASGVALVIADPVSFNLQHGLPKLTEVCGVLSLVHVALYLQKSPLWTGEPSVQVNAPSAETVNVTNQPPQ